MVFYKRMIADHVWVVAAQVDLERTQDELLDDVHQRIRKAKVDGGLVPHNPPRGKRPPVRSQRMFLTRVY